MNHRELEILLQDLFEGVLDGAALDGLQIELRQNPEAREIYREYVRLHNALQIRSEGVDLLRVVSMDRVVERRQRRSIRNAGLAAAALLVLAGFLMLFILVRTPPPTLTFATSPGTDFSVSALSGEGVSGEAVLEPGSRLEIRAGTVELKFASGVRGIVRGPADMTLHEEGLLYVARGTGWFHVPEDAIGFKVNTPDLLLTDLGTEFGVLSQPDFLDEVHVFTGKVEVVNRYGLKRRELITAGQARVAGPAGRWKETKCQTSPFLTVLPTTDPESEQVVFSDAFDRDSSDDYICFDYYGGRGVTPDAFSIDEENGDVLEVRGGTNQAIHRTATLGVGEIFKTDLLTQVVSASASQILTDAHHQRRYSIRLRVSDGVFAIDFRNGQTGSFTMFNKSPFTAPETLWVHRVSAKEFTWYRGASDSELTKIAEIQFDTDPGVLFVGLQACSKPARFDNLKILEAAEDFGDGVRADVPSEEDDR